LKRARVFAWGWALIVALLLGHNACLWLVQRIVPDTDILALLPVQQRDPLLQQSFIHMVDAAQQRVVVLVGADDWAGAARAADAYAAVLKTAPALLRIAAADEATQGAWLALFQQHRAVLLTAAQESRLRPEDGDFWLGSALEKLYAPFGGPRLGPWQDDPFGLFGAWMAERAQETPVRPRDGRLFVAAPGKNGRQYVLLPLTLLRPALSMTAQDALLPLLARADAAARAATPALELISAGVVLHAAAASRQAETEVSTIGVGSLLGIVLLMWFSFTSWRPVALILLAIGVGCLGALSLCWLMFGRVHLLTLVFGASLIGVAQDYGLYFICHRLTADADLASPALLRRLLPALALTLLAAVIGYMGLALTPFPGLRQMALFSALGLVFAWLTVACWFPVLLPAGVLREGALTRRYGALLVRWPRWRGDRRGVVALALFAVLAIAGMARLKANDDIRLLQHPPERLVADQVKLGKLLDAPTPVQFYLVRGGSAEQVLQREEALKKRLDPMVLARRISGYQAVSNWVPSLATQAARRALLERTLWQAGGPLERLAAQTQADAGWADAVRERLRAAAAPLTVDDFMASPASEPWRHLWLGKIDGAYAGIVALRGLDYAALAQLRRAGDGIDGVMWVDKVAEISAVLGAYRRTMGWVLLGAYAVVFCLLLPRYRRRTWRVLAPAAMASVGVLALLGWTGQPLQLFHVLALMLLLGVGVDYGIFMQEPARARGTPWLAVGLSAVNTILSFGLLALSRTPALQAFGLTMLAGILLVWLLVPCFGAAEALDERDKNNERDERNGRDEQNHAQV
jgi:predicted exporter